MTTDTANQIISKYESLVVLCTYNILLTNDICYGQVIECLHAMKRTPYYKQAFKRYLNDADKARKEYERTVNRTFGNRQVSACHIWRKRYNRSGGLSDGCSYYLLLFAFFVLKTPPEYRYSLRFLRTTLLI